MSAPSTNPQYSILLSLRGRTWPKQTFEVHLEYNIDYTYMTHIVAWLITILIHKALIIPSAANAPVTPHFDRQYDAHDH